MSSWRDQLQPASFRGVPFEVESDSSPAGRKTQTHEFVQRDQPFVEDLGRKTREFKLTGFVGGADCFQKRDALLAALDKPGPGELVHPWLGKLNVTAGEGCEYSHDRSEGGLVRFSLVFVEAGEKGFPAGTPNTGRQLLKAKAGLWDVAKSKFSLAMAAVNAGRSKMNVLQSALMAPYNAAQSYFGEAMRAVGSVTGFADKLVGSPAGFMALFSSLSGSVSGLSGIGSSFGGGGGGSGSSFGGSGGSAGSSAGSSVADGGGASGFAPALQALLGRAQAANSLSSTYAYTGDSTTGQVAQAGQRLVRDALLVQIAAEAAAMPVLLAPPRPPATPSLDQQVAQPVTRDAVPVTDDVLSVRDAVNEAFWAAALDADHERFEWLEVVRKAVFRHLTAVAGAGVRLVEVTPRATEPALVLAYRRFGDASRAGEIVTRNRIRHPGFVPPAALQVAQE